MNRRLRAQNNPPMRSTFRSTKSRFLPNNGLASFRVELRNCNGREPLIVASRLKDGCEVIRICA